MNPHAPKRHVALVAVDRSIAGDGVIWAAASIARPNSEIHVVHVLATMSMDRLLVDGGDNEGERAAIQDARNFLAEIVTATRIAEAKRLYAHLVAGEPARSILQAAADLRADLIVIGTHDHRGVRRMMLGSVSEAVAKRAQCHVLVVRPTNYEDNLPEIDAPCAQCLSAQVESRGEVLWCEAHRHHRRHAHVYHWSGPPTYGEGSMFVK